jgi:hypothetical protein
MVRSIDFSESKASQNGLPSHDTLSRLFRNLNPALKSGCPGGPFHLELLALFYVDCKGIETQI